MSERLNGEATHPHGHDVRLKMTLHELLLLLILASIQFTHIVDFVIIMPLGPVFRQEMHLPPSQFGWVVSMYTYSAGLAGLLAARFLDRFDRKKALVLLYAGFITGTLLCSAAPNFWFLLIGRTVAGAFGGVVAAVVLAIVGDAFPDVRRGTAMGIVLAAFSVASFVGVPLGLLLAELQGWRSTFVALGMLSLGVLALAAVVLPPFRGHLGRGRHRPIPTWPVLVHPNHLRAFCLTGMLVFGSFIIGPFLPTFLEANVGVQQDELKYMYLFGGMATIVTMPYFGRLADRFGKLRVFQILAFLCLIPISIVTNLPAGLALGVVLGVTTLFMIVTSGRWVPAMALVTASSAPAYRGSFMSLNSAVQQLAAGLATSVAGYLLVETEQGTLVGFWLLGLLACAASLLSMALAARLRKAAGGDLAPDSRMVAVAAKNGELHGAHASIPEGSVPS